MSNPGTHLPPSPLGAGPPTSTASLRARVRDACPATYLHAGGATLATLQVPAKVQTRSRFLRSVGGKVGILLGLATVLGGCVTSNMLKSLNRPAEFQKLYGDHVRIVTLQTIPSNPWRGLSIKGWTFDHVTFRETLFDADTFENVHFQDCTFDDVTMQNSVFRNCTFRNCQSLSGLWQGNNFIGGKISYLETAKSSNSDYIGTWKHNSFENMTLQDMTITHQGGDWESFVFKNVIFRNNDIRYANVGGEFHQCTFEGNAIGTGMGTCGLQGTFHQCTFGKNHVVDRMIEGRFIAPKFLQSYDGHFDLFGDFEDVDLPVRNVKVGIGRKSRNVRISGPLKGFRGGGDDIEFHDVFPGGVGLGGGHRIKATDIDAGEFSFDDGTFVDCVFRNVYVKDLVFMNGPQFVRCTFENFLITRGIYQDKPYATFEDCKFINVRRAPNVLVREWDDTPPPPPYEYTFPWESSPGVSKPDTP
ncbi:MAG: pentapeptide repeat-containing protein [Fibrobacteria bacterium]|nr:pentapeptide repeat-containing protein [Fibrobacteria bacterium]